jgi:hypothetical protein
LDCIFTLGLRVEGGRKPPAKTWDQGSVMLQFMPAVGTEAAFKFTGHRHVPLAAQNWNTTPSSSNSETGP